MAGDFEISIDRFETENGRLIMVGQMGVWDARTYITPRELVTVLGKLLHPRILFYLLKLPVLAFAKNPNRPVSQGGNEQ
jgi:hypothetical protein